MFELISNSSSALVKSLSSQSKQWPHTGHFQWIWGFPFSGGHLCSLGKSNLPLIHSIFLQAGSDFNTFFRFQRLLHTPSVLSLCGNTVPKDTSKFHNICISVYGNPRNSSGLIESNCKCTCGIIPGYLIDMS